MCAIAGVINLADGVPHAPELYESMLSTMRRRGPDQTGLYTDEASALLHARLSVPVVAHEARPAVEKIVTPLARLYYRNEDYVSAQKTISIFASIARRDDSFKNKIESLKESVAAPKKTKREKTAL